MALDRGPTSFVKSLGSQVASIKLGIFLFCFAPVRVEVRHSYYGPTKTQGEKKACCFHTFSNHFIFKHFVHLTSVSSSEVEHERKCLLSNLVSPESHPSAQDGLHRWLCCHSVAGVQHAPHFGPMSSVKQHDGPRFCCVAHGLLQVGGGIARTCSRPVPNEKHAPKQYHWVKI